MKRWRLALTAVGVVLGVLMSALPGEGVTTRTFTLDSSTELSAGTLEGVAVSDDGTVTRGVSAERVSFPEAVGSVWSLLDLGDGSVLAGTGVDGKVYRLANGRATLYADTGAVAVTGLARGDGGAVYAATLPDGKVFRLVPPANDRPQEPVLVAELPGAQHVWALAWDARRRALLCATGPEGKLFAVDPRRPSGSNHTVLFDSVEPHLYAMALRPDGEAVVGAGGGHAVVYGVSATGTPRVIARLAGDEVRGVAVAGDVVWAASNEFTDPPAAPRRSTAQSRQPSPGGPTSPARPRPGKGNVYRISPTGLADRYWHDDAAHVASIEWDSARNELYAGLGVGGRVLAFRDDRSWRTLLDLDEHQALALSLSTRARVIGTADGGSLYRVTDAAPPAAVWTSKVLDATVPSHWGAVRWRGEGALDWESRSGNTDAPDDTWSAWQTLGDDGAVRSPAARYVQVRARFGRASDTAIRSVTVYYLPENQRAVLTEVTASTPETKAGEPRPTTLRVQWKVDNPDRDTIRYRLRFRRDGEETWRPVLRNQEYTTETRHDWALDGLPEGWYRVEVEASDEASNPDDGVTRDRRAADPLLVDVTPPTVTVRVNGERVEGEATDGVSAILRAEVSLDGGDWRPLRAVDGVFDERVERFTGALPSGGATAGDHLVAVRAFDEANNVGVVSARYRR